MEFQVPSSPAGRTAWRRDKSSALRLFGLIPDQHGRANQEDRHIIAAGSVRFEAGVLGTTFCSGGPRSASATARSLKKMTADDLASCGTVGGHKPRYSLAKYADSESHLQSELGQSAAWGRD